MFPPAENLAMAEAGVALDVCPPVLAYTSLSITKILTSSPLAEHDQCR